MVSNEIRDTITIAVSLIVLSIVLTFVAIIMGIKADLASSRNSAIESAKHIDEYREFNKYNNSEVFGEDVVCAIRDFYDRGIRVRVTGGGEEYYVDKYVARENPDLIDIDKLRARFPVTKVYKAVLVYGQVDLNTVTQDYIPDTINNNVSSVVFFYERER